MASYSLTVGGRPSGVHKTLSGTTADTVTINTAAAKCAVLATLINRSAGDITFRLDGTYILPAGKDYPFIVNGAPVVSIIAGSALAYSLQTAPATDG